MNNLRIKWGAYYYDIFAPEDDYQMQCYSWYVCVSNSKIYPSSARYVDYIQCSQPVPVDVFDHDALRKWLETAYALGELPVGEEWILP
jgi:hypothetical protein